MRRRFCGEQIRTGRGRDGPEEAAAWDDGGRDGRGPHRRVHPDGRGRLLPSERGRQHHKDHGHERHDDQGPVRVRAHVKGAGAGRRSEELQFHDREPQQRRGVFRVQLPINRGGTPTVTTSEFLDKHYVDVTFNVAGYLKPVAGDFLQLPSPTLGADPGTAITGVSQTGPDQYKLTVSDSLANLSGQPVTNQVGQNEVAVIRRQRTYMIDSVTGTTLLWYPNDGSTPAS